MQAYMKSQMPYAGLAAPGLRRVCNAVFQDHLLDGFAEWRDTALEVWRGARVREERYAAIELTGHRRYRSHQTPDAFPMYEEMIVTGAWWDFVDALAIHRVGSLVRSHPDLMKGTMREWSRCDDLWKRRTSILCQNSFKTETDLDLLYECIEANLSDADFFIRKAIGWALRQYAWTDPEEVARYVDAHSGRLSALSRREARKNLP